MNTSRVRELAEHIMKHAKYLSIDKGRAQEVAGMLKNFDLVLPKWNFPGFYPQSDDFEEMCKFYLLFNSINYCYYDQDGNKFQDGDKSGSTLACSRLTEFWDELQKPEFLINVDENFLLNELFRAERPISLVKERVVALREVARFYNQNLETSEVMRKFFLRFRKDAYVISQAIPIFFPTWSDPFYKRAQLFVGMIYGRFQDLEDLPIKKETLQDLTVPADYVLPKNLIGMGIIKPYLELSNRIYGRVFIPSGSQAELEIRAATIVSADLLLEELKKIKNDTSLHVFHVDYLLWMASRPNFEGLPKEVFRNLMPTNHLTYTTDY